MAKDPREYGFEGEMVMSQLKGIMNHAKQLHDMLEPSTDLPEWVQSKITKAYDYVQTAADYMATEMNEEVAHSVHVRTYDKQGEKQMNSPAFKSHLKAHGGDHHYSSDKGVAFKFKQKSSAEAFHRGVQSKFRDLGSEHDVHEEIQIDELSKDTMKSYKGKAFTQYMNMTHGPTDWNKQPEKVRDKAAQRMRGMNTADKKLKKEEAQLDELSKETMKSYVGKADARTMDRVIDDPKARRKAQNRTFGIEKAVKKIAEDGAVNAAGAGNVAGLGVGPQGEPGVNMKKRKKTVLARFKRFTRP
jgi:hypothetical protein